MNTYDEELALSDYALRRRFCFYNVDPVFDNPSFKAFYMQNPLLTAIIEKIKEINQTLDESKQIGHSYFCKPMPDAEIKMLVKYSVIPLLKEYFKDEPAKFEKVSKELLNIIKDAQ
jgi:5-methylcytosine-specific restriction protein B